MCLYLASFLADVQQYYHLPHEKLDESAKSVPNGGLWFSHQNLPRTARCLLQPDPRQARSPSGDPVRGASSAGSRQRFAKADLFALAGK